MKSYSNNSFVKSNPTIHSGRRRDRGMVEVEGNRNYVTFLPAQTMYTNPANLQQTIWLQQQLFRQALNRNRGGSGVGGTASTPNPSTPATSRPRGISSNRGSSTLSSRPTNLDEPIQMEWKVWFLLFLLLLSSLQIIILFNFG